MKKVEQKKVLHKKLDNEILSFGLRVYQDLMNQQSMSLFYGIFLICSPL